MTKEWQYIPGDNWVICDQCGEKHRKSVMKLRWDNMWVDPLCFELRHPQDFVRARNDKIVADVIRNRPADVFVPEDQCTLETRQGVVGYGTVGCAMVGWIYVEG